VADPKEGKIELTKTKSLAPAAPGVKIALKALVKEEFAELQDMLLANNRRTLDATDASFQDFYRNKYRGRYIHDKQTSSASTSSQQFETLNSISIADNSSPQSGTRSTLTASQHMKSQDKNERRKWTPKTEQLYYNWNAYRSRGGGKGTKGLGKCGGGGKSKYYYQMSKDHHESRGPPYHVNNTNATWQR